MQCKNCGRLNQSGSLYCQDCGQRLADLAPGERPQALPTPPTGLERGGGAVPAASFGAPASYGGYAPPAAAPVAAPSGPGPCARCGTQNPPHMRFCNSCGNPLIPAPAPQAPVVPPVAQMPNAAYARAAPPTCWRCRSAVDAGAEFCKFCGARYSDGGGVQPAAAQPAPAAPSVGAAVAAAVAAHAFGSAPPGGNQAAPPPAASPRNDRTNLEQPASAIDRAVPLGILVAILKDGSDGRTYPLLDEQTDIGRSEGQITLGDDPYLSLRHARLHVKKDEIKIRDLDSLNGVYLRLRDPVDLNDGDYVLLGQQVMRFEVLPEPESPLGPAMLGGVLVFGTPEVARVARLLQYTTEGVARDVHYLYRDETVVGREQGDIVCTDDPFMSRRHASITYDRTTRHFALKDLGSSNGTAIRVRGERALKPGDQFRVGRHLFRYDRPERARA